MPELAFGVLLRETRKKVEAPWLATKGHALARPGANNIRVLLTLVLWPARARRDQQRWNLKLLQAETNIGEHLNEKT